MSMAITLMKWTEQGVRNYRESVDRYEKAKELAERFGLKMKEIYWTPGGPYDLIAVMEVDDFKNAAAFQLTVEAMGNLRIKTVNAYGPEGMREIISTTGS